jgi:hypothetical protein
MPREKRDLLSIDAEWLMAISVEKLVLLFCYSHACDGDA